MDRRVQGGKSQIAIAALSPKPPNLLIALARTQYRFFWVLLQISEGPERYNEHKKVVSLSFSWLLFRL